MKSRRPSLMIHGGAGALRDVAPARERAYHDSLRGVLEVGWEMLRDGVAAVDVVQACVAPLEDDPLYNAGRGSVSTAAGTVEMDAAIMDGAGLWLGAVACVPRVKNPVVLARLVMEESPHVFLVGAGALDLAKRHGLRLKGAAYFKVDRTEKTDKEHGTVGAVARDMRGHLAAATSTGGTTGQQPGRVGDSPVPGAGVWAEDGVGAVSCTGKGEDFLRTALAKHAAGLLADGSVTARRAAGAALRYLEKSVGGSGGLILVDRRGAVAGVFNTGGMLRGWVGADGRVRTALR